MDVTSFLLLLLVHHVPDLSAVACVTSVDDTPAVMILLLLQHPGFC
jgi:hypothetical protein